MREPLRAFAFCCTSVLVACSAQGGSPRSAPASEEAAGGASPAADTGADAAAEPMVEGGELGDDSVQLMDEQGLAFDALGEALELANCDDAFGHRDAICDLSDRICAIAEDHPRAVDRCDDAQIRCASARERVADECD